MLKSSFYNVLIPIEEKNEYLLYNLLSGGLEVLPYKEGNIFQNWIDDGAFDPDQLISFKDFIDYLQDRNYLVHENHDEKAAFKDIYNSGRENLFDLDKASLTITIGTTITCNMGCPYCFEFVKPNKTLKDPEVMKQMIWYLQQLVDKAPVKKWANFSLCWYGGEPLINKKLIREFSPMIHKFCADNGIEKFDAQIITNGILLDEEAWKILHEAQVSHLQVTIDGSKETHNEYRPLKSGGENYEKILRNIAAKPDDMTLTIRVNTDKKVASNFGQFFDDLYDYGIWPQKSDTITVDSSVLRSYEENEEDTSDRLDADAYQKIHNEFKMTKMERYNAWACENGKKTGRIGWDLPTVQQECSTWVNPYHIVFDPEGNVHKCWETIHDDKQMVKHCSDGYEISDFKHYMSYDRHEFSDICANCKFLPVCDSYTCSFEAYRHEEKPPCTIWKSNLESVLKDQYIMMLDHPEIIANPVGNEVLNGGHANK
ncbi:MAG: radical SAM protein [Cytophagales bacterium]|nr:radical SAM protein [Cytophagales bacterium]